MGAGELAEGVAEHGGCDWNLTHVHGDHEGVVASESDGREGLRCLEVNGFALLRVESGRVVDEPAVRFPEPLVLVTSVRGWQGGVLELTYGDRIDWVDDRQSMEYDGGGIGEATTADVVLDLDEVAGRVSLVLRLRGGYFLRDRLAGWSDTVQFEDVETDVLSVVLLVLVYLILNHLDQVDGVTEAEVLCADCRVLDREGDDRMDRVDVADATGLLVLGKGHVVAVVGVDLKLVASDGGGVLAPVDLGLVLRFVLVLRVEDDWSIVLAEVDGVFATFDDRHNRLFVDGDEDRVGSGTYVVRIRHGVGVEHAVLVVDVCQLVRLGLAEEGSRSVEDSAILVLESCRVGEVG